MRITGTKVTRTLEFRADSIGVYFLSFFEDDSLAGGFSYQWPEWFSVMLGGTPDAHVCRNLLSFYVLEELDHG